MKCDVAVIGAGSAGIAAAVAAAESGLKVLLVERYGFVGGLATAAMVGTICGLYYRDHCAMDCPRYAVRGFAREFADAVKSSSNTRPAVFAEGLHFLPYQPAVFHEQAVRRLKQAGVRLLLHMSVTGVKVRDGQVSELGIHADDGPLDVYPKTVVDCSGNAQVSMLAGLDMLTQTRYQSAAFVFQVSGLPHMEPRLLALNLIRWIKRGIQSGDLDSHCERLSIVPGTVEQGVGLLKLGLPELFNGESVNGELMNLTDYELEARSRSLEMIEYLRHADPLLKALRITAMAAQVGIRSGPRPRGIKRLEAEHLLACAKPDDGVAIGAWPIELWEGGRNKPQMRYFNTNDFYLIPAAALVSRYLDNLFFAGRAFSATESAMASARVIGTCLSTGYAAGMLAAEFARTGAWRGGVEKIRMQQVLAQEV